MTDLNLTHDYQHFIEEIKIGFYSLVIKRHALLIRNSFFYITIFEKLYPVESILQPLIVELFQLKNKLKNKLKMKIYKRNLFTNRCHKVDSHAFNLLIGLRLIRGV